MDARFYRATLVAAVLSSLGASYRTQNFLVTADTPELAHEVCEQAERYRAELAVEWLGQELPAWQQPCPITVQCAPDMGAGGATSFAFDQGQPFDFTMTIQGSRERLLDSVLPHEVTHTIFATHFGRPLPRWADEGACTTVEHTSERQKQHRLLYEFLTTGRGIAFNDMFAMKDYPTDILPLYSQGYSLARFLIAQGGKRKFVEYVGEGMQRSNWTSATREIYGYRSLSELQLTWLDWVRQGSPQSVAPFVARNQPGPAASDDVAHATPISALLEYTDEIDEAAPPTTPADAGDSSSSWYVRQRDRVRQPSNRPATPLAADPNSGKTGRGPQMLTRPQPPQQMQTLILERSSRQPMRGSSPAFLQAGQGSTTFR